MEEIYETEVWKNLDKNVLFRSKFEEILKKCMYYAEKNNVGISIKGNKLIITYYSRLMNRETDCQFIRNAKYEFSLDFDNNLIINEMIGSLRSNFGYDFVSSNGGELSTFYSCEVYDEDGIELSYQGYSDTYDINEPQFNAYKNGFLPAIETAYNPNLASFANVTGVYLHANIIGESGKFTRQIRSKNDLGVVINTSCQFDRTGKVINPKEEYYFNTFMSHQSLLNPGRISIARNFPFATLGDDHVMHFSKIYSDLTMDNYKEKANAKFLNELLKEKDENGRHIPKEISDTYDLIIEKLENQETMNRTL